jgi:hypothetical protein
MGAREGKDARGLFGRCGIDNFLGWMCLIQIYGRGDVCMNTTWTV